MDYCGLFYWRGITYIYLFACLCPVGQIFSMDIQFYNLSLGQAVPFPDPVSHLDIFVYSHLNNETGKTGQAFIRSSQLSICSVQIKFFYKTPFHGFVNQYFSFIYTIAPILLRARSRPHYRISSFGNGSLSYRPFIIWY